MLYCVLVSTRNKDVGVNNKLNLNYVKNDMIKRSGKKVPCVPITMNNNYILSMRKVKV